MRFAPGTPQSVINAAIGTFGPGSGLAPRPIPRPVPIPNGVNPEDYERMITEGGSINIPGGGTISSAGGMARPIPRQFLDGAMGGGKPNVNLNVLTTASMRSLPLQWPQTKAPRRKNAIRRC
jgi:CubicO group peptidase (beta-lactamase class C family)